MRAVDPAGRQQLLRADHTQRVTQFVADQVLPAVATREREIRRLHVLPPRQPREKPRVLVVRMRADHQDTRRGPESGGRRARRHRDLGGEPDEERRPCPPPASHYELLVPLADPAGADEPTASLVTPRPSVGAARPWAAAVPPGFTGGRPSTSATIRDCSRWCDA